MQQINGEAPNEVCPVPQKKMKKKNAKVKNEALRPGGGEGGRWREGLDWVLGGGERDMGLGREERERDGGRAGGYKMKTFFFIFFWLDQ